MRQLFEAFGKQSNPNLEIIDFEDLIDYLNSNDQWFNALFNNI